MRVVRVLAAHMLVPPWRPVSIVLPLPLPAPQGPTSQEQQQWPAKVQCSTRNHPPSPAPCTAAGTWTSGRRRCRRRSRSCCGSGARSWAACLTAPKTFLSSRFGSIWQLAAAPAAAALPFCPGSGGGLPAVAESLLNPARTSPPACCSYAGGGGRPCCCGGRAAWWPGGLAPRCRTHHVRLSPLARDA